MKLPVLLFFLVVAPAFAVTIHDNLRPSGVSVPGAAASIQTASCATANCTATATCPENSVIVSAVSREDSSTCTGVLSSLTGTYIRLDCYGGTSCAQTESGLGNLACVRVSCAGN